jgi:competence protein ComEA
MATRGSKMAAAWSKVRAFAGSSAWTPLAAKAGAAVAGFALLALAGSGALAGLTPRAQATAALPTSAALAPAPPPASAAAPPASAAADADEGAAAPEAQDAGADTADAGSSPAITPDGKVMINAATEDDLRRLPGIGPAKAKAILALRSRLGKFKRPEDLLRVKGLGRRKLARLRPLLVVD